MRAERSKSKTLLSASEPGPLASLLPNRFFLSERLGNFDDCFLNEREKELTRDFVPKRLAEFAAGRTCAREALSCLGFKEFPVLVGSNREPLWPENVVGSITHCEGYAAAAVALQSRFRAIGIDAEPNGSIDADVQRLIMSERELEHIRKLADEIPGVHWDRLMFSAKESVYKAWFPTYGQWLDFSNCEVVFHLEMECFSAQSVEPFHGRYSVRILFDARSYFYNGKWALLPSHNLLATAVLVPSS